VGLHDRYVPVPAIECARCGATITEWQGKNGPCDVVVWTQGNAAPAIDARDDWPPDPERLAVARLPEAFLLYGTCPTCEAFANAIGLVERGVWSRTLVPDRAAIAKREPAFEDEPGRRRCGLCDNVWVCAPSTVVTDCPGCGTATVLVREG
jgi:hypothetical protein